MILLDLITLSATKDRAVSEKCPERKGAFRAWRLRSFSAALRSQKRGRESPRPRGLPPKHSGLLS